MLIRKTFIYLFFKPLIKMYGSNFKETHESTTIPIQINMWKFELNNLQSPNLVGSPLGLLQLVLYCIYRNKEHQQEAVKKEKEGCVEPMPNWDIQKNNNQHQIPHQNSSQV